MAPGRIVGLDIARAFAIVGMVIVNFKVVITGTVPSAGWLGAATSLMDGRAAATFVVLAGIGATLGSRRAIVGPAEARTGARIALLRRALFLFLAGWVFFLVWPADILHYYGVYLAIGAATLFVRDRTLLALAVAATAVCTLFLVSFDPFENWDLTDLSYEGLTTVEGFVRNLFFDGFHPVFPWVAFYLVGMRLGRLDLRDRRLRRRMLGWALVTMAAVETLALVVVGPRGTGIEQLADDSLRWFASVEPIPPFPMFVLAGTATAIAVILGSIELGEGLPTRITWPLVAAGQLALTIYVAHVMLGLGALEALGRLEGESLGWAVSTALAFSAASVLAATLWRRRFARGPLELLLRRIAG